MKNYKRKIKGVSLIELILYISIMGIMLAAITPYIISSKKVDDRDRVINEVEFQGQYITDVIAQTIRNAKSIGSITTSSISLVVDSNSPTVFDLSNGYLRSKKGTGAYVNLSSDKIIISNLTFQNYGNVNTNGSIHFQFSIAYSNPGNKEELNYSKTFWGAGSLR